MCVLKNDLLVFSVAPRPSSAQVSYLNTREEKRALSLSGGSVLGSVRSRTVCFEASSTREERTDGEHGVNWTGGAGAC